MIIIFTHGREAMLHEQLSKWMPIGRIPVVIIEDGTEYKKINRTGVTHYQFEHQGKRGFWKLWSFALEQAYRSDVQSFLFMPDDFTQLQLREATQVLTHLDVIPFVLQVVNDGRPPQWSNFNPKSYTLVEEVGWQDCGFFCNREALERIGFNMQPIPESRFDIPNISSGVGEQLTRRFAAAGVRMFRPHKSLAYHGDHDSVMHPEERKLNPIISQH